MSHQLLVINRKHWRISLKYRYIAAICFIVGLDVVTLAANNEFRAELNRLLVSAAGKEPALFGTDALCERDNGFWDEVNDSSLLAVLEREAGFQEIPLNRGFTVWFVPISHCFSGNRTGVVMFARMGNKFHSVETPIIGNIENIRLEGDKIVFDVTTYAGLWNEYRYVYSYDGKQLTQELLKRIQR